MLEQALADRMSSDLDWLLKEPALRAQTPEVRCLLKLIRLVHLVVATRGLPSVALALLPSTVAEIIDQLGGKTFVNGFYAQHVESKAEFARQFALWQQRWADVSCPACGAASIEPSAETLGQPAWGERTRPEMQCSACDMRFVPR